MPQAAAPAYLGRDFQDASPGLRFGAYLRLWEADWSKAKSGKADATRATTWLTPDDKRHLAALVQRQSALAATLAVQDRLLTLDARSVAPFTTGLGNEHPLENGFAFLNPYGLPYLPGSGVKGVLRQAALELESGNWGEAQGWTEDAITWLFGLESDDGDKNHQRGALAFWDVLPLLAGDALQVEVMTPHQSHYHQQRREARSGDSTSPHDSGQPNPIHFLTVPPASKFSFHVQCDVPFLAHHAPALAEGGRWQALLQAAFTHAFAWLGFGAKTAVGYGAMAEDRQAAVHRARAATEAQAAAALARQQAEREAAKHAMPDADRAMADLFDQRQDKNQDERAVLFTALKAGKLAAFQAEAAQRLQQLMQAQGRWREKSEKKNPDKDQPYQDTLLVKKWLAC